jgi:hypothetical protein
MNTPGTFSYQFILKDIRGTSGNCQSQIWQFIKIEGKAVISYYSIKQRFSQRQWELWQKFTKAFLRDLIQFKRDNFKCLNRKMLILKDIIIDYLCNIE